MGPSRADRHKMMIMLQKDMQELMLKNPASRERLQNWKSPFPPGYGLEASATLNPKETFTPAGQEDWQPYSPFKANASSQ